MQHCTLYKKIEIVPGTYEDYKQLAQYHYRDNGPGQFTTIYALKPKKNYGLGVQTIGVIVYSTATLGQELRNIATDNFFIGFNQRTQLALLNKYVRRISRIIIEPRFRGLGLAKHLVRETMPMMNFPIIEAVAVMGTVNPFFEKAGMKAYIAPEKVANIRLKEALSAVGIEEELWIDPPAVQKTIERLPRKSADFIETELKLFLQSYADRRYSRPSLKRTTFILNKLSNRAVYYIWFKE
jgi:GNAT superfamily N-acetyltransferase